MDAFEAELRNVIECVRKNQESDILGGRLGPGRRQALPNAGRQHARRLA